MLKNLLNLKGVVALNKRLQHAVFGGGTCSAMVSNGQGEIYVEHNLSKGDAIAMGGRWCCDSCATATWIDSCNVCQ